MGILGRGDTLHGEAAAAQEDHGCKRLAGRAVLAEEVEREEAGEASDEADAHLRMTINDEGSGTACERCQREQLGEDVRGHGTAVHLPVKRARPARCSRSGRRLATGHSAMQMQRRRTHRGAAGVAFGS